MYGLLVDFLIGIDFFAGSCWIAYDEFQHFCEYLEVVVVDSFSGGPQMEHYFLKSTTKGYLVLREDYLQLRDDAKHQLL